MNISDAGLHLIASFEGFVPTWYKDSGGVPTIGYGHTGTLPAGFRAPLTAAQGLALLRLDAATAQGAVNSAVKVNLGLIPSRRQARFDACCSLAFNIGGGAFSGSTLVKVINEKGAPRDWTPLGPYWLEWDHDNGAVLPGLLSRRREEFAIFQSGKYLT